MKFKTTKKEINNGYNTIIKVGYCSLQNLLSRKQPTAYTCGSYGWNADIYSFGSTAIVTGYRPFGNVKPDYEIIKRYEEEAKKIKLSSADYNTINEALDILVEKLIKELTA